MNLQESGHHRLIGIVDIGSNSIRLVVYDSLSRTPVPMFNEKAICALGLGLGASGRLNPEGVPTAILAIGRFVRLARAMDLAHLYILATAAVRDASDGPAFVNALEIRYGVPVQILSGGEEAELAALGVLCGKPEAEGIVADLGGGSLELIEMADGGLGRHVTMPLGVLRLAEAAGDDRPKAIALVDRHLGKIDWVTSATGQALYTTGGAWRAIARICIAQTAHPLSVLDNYTLDRRDALRLIELISRQSRKSLEKIPGISKKRLPTLPLAALLLERVLLATQPARLVFSVYGMREGQFYKVMPSYLREQDALIGACTEMARKAGRFPEHSGEIMQWMAPLFVPRETPPQRRLRQAACLLSDVFWNEHPDYRAEQGFLRVLRLPFMGLGHRDRAALALTVYTRYGGPDDGGTVAECRSLLNDEDMRRARAIGWALRLAHTVSGAAPGLLGLTRLVIEGKSLVLVLPATDPTFQPELGERRYDKLAKAAGCDALVVRRV